MLNIEILSSEQMEAIDQHQAQQQSDWKSVPPQGVTTNFIGTRLNVLPGVFPPKRDTQLLTELLDINSAKSALDVGTGTGALAIWVAENSQASVVAIDISEAAFRNAKENVEVLGLNERIQVRLGNINSCLLDGEKFDVIIANLPGRNKKANDHVSAAQWDTEFHAHRELFAEASNYLHNSGKIYMVKANYPDLLEMIDLAKSNYLRTAIIGKSDATEDDPRVYYALSLSKIDAIDSQQQSHATDPEKLLGR